MKGKTHSKESDSSVIAKQWLAYLQYVVSYCRSHPHIAVCQLRPTFQIYPPLIDNLQSKHSEEIYKSWFEKSKNCI